MKTVLVKAVGIKAPVIIGGWGYTTDGNPVPSGETAETVDEFLPNYQKRADKWKVGPLDIKWDDRRKVWATGDVGGVVIGKTTSSIIYGGSGSVTIGSFDSTKINIPLQKPFTYGGSSVTAYEHCLAVGEIIYANSLVAMTVVDGEYVIIHVICDCRN